MKPYQGKTARLARQLADVDSPFHLLARNKSCLKKRLTFRLIVLTISPPTN